MSRVCTVVLLSVKTVGWGRQERVGLYLFINRYSLIANVKPETVNRITGNLMNDEFFI